MMNVKFQQHDNIVMQSIYFSQGVFKTGATFTKIIELGDRVDKSIIDYEQLKGSLSRFLTSGLIYLRKDKVYLTKKYRQVRRNNKNNKGLESELITLIFKELSNDEYAVMKELPNDYLRESKWHSAYAIYKGRFKE
jgi:hypothetical protein